MKTLPLSLPLVLGALLISEGAVGGWLARFQEWLGDRSFLEP